MRVIHEFELEGKVKRSASAMAQGLALIRSNAEGAISIAEQRKWAHRNYSDLGNEDCSPNIVFGIEERNDPMLDSMK